MNYGIRVNGLTAYGLAKLAQIMGERMAFKRENGDVIAFVD